MTLLGFAHRHTRCGRAGSAATASGFTEAEAAERAAAELESAVEIVTVEEAIEMRAMYPSSTLVALRAPNLRLFQEALARARGAGDTAVYVIFVDEIPGLFFPPKTGPSREAREVLTRRRSTTSSRPASSPSRSGAWPTTPARRSRAPPASWASRR